MDFRPAEMRDLPRIQAVYRDIVKQMNSRQIQIWDDVYPCAFFAGDITERRLYVLCRREEILSAFALCGTNPGEKAVKWQKDRCRALYLERFGVNADYSGRGIGSLMLEKAKETAKNAGADYLRLFVAEENRPAIGLYSKNGFLRCGGIYEEAIGDGSLLREYGFETAL